ncbi:MAG: tetratricopeptide repeat protein [Candidatus Cloacimonetes bacterium]|nr:tetratricopeptide repeat protein [Candidatus Cloacimonadota bacterium]
MKNLIKGNYQKAGECFQKALQLAENTENRFNLGLFLLNRQRFEEAEEIFTGIAGDYPENEINGLLLFESFMLLEKWEAAIKQIRKLCQLNQTAKKYMILRTVAEDVVAREKYRKVKILKSEAQELLSARKTENALMKYQEAEQYSPADSEILNNIGSIFLKAKEYVRAYTYFEKALELDPDNQIVKRNLVTTKGRLRTTRKKL